MEQRVWGLYSPEVKRECKNSSMLIFDDFCKGQGNRKDLEILYEHVEYMGPGRTFCALAPGATAPLGSGLRYFSEDFEKLIKD